MHTLITHVLDACWTKQAEFAPDEALIGLTVATQILLGFLGPCQRQMQDPVVFDPDQLLHPGHGSILAAKQVPRRLIEGCHILARADSVCMQPTSIPHARQLIVGMYFTIIQGTYMYFVRQVSNGGAPPCRAS